MRRQAKTMTLNQEGNYFRIVFENEDEQTEIRLPLWKMERWGREMMERALRQREIIESRKNSPIVRKG